MVVWENAPARKSGWLSTPELIASARMNAAVAVRKSNPMRTAVFLVDAILCVVTVDIRDLLLVGI
jgi:hypothetical protein